MASSARWPKPPRSTWRWRSSTRRARWRSAWRGPDAGFFLGADGEGAVLRAVEHLLQRVYAGAGGEEPLRVECAGFRDRRERALSEQALALAAEVRADGRPGRRPP